MSQTKYRLIMTETYTKAITQSIEYPYNQNTGTDVIQYSIQFERKMEKEMDSVHTPVYFASLEQLLIWLSKNKNKKLA